MFPMTTAYPHRAGRHQRPFNHRRAKVSAERKRDTWISNTGFMQQAQLFHRHSASQSRRGVNHRIQSTGSTAVWDLDLVIPLQWQLINMDPLLLICCLWPSTITKSSGIAMTLPVPIHITPHRQWRRKDERWHLSRFRNSSHIYAHFCIITSCLIVGPVTLLTSCLDTYRPGCSGNQSVGRKDNNAGFIPTLSYVSKALYMCLILVANNNHFPLLCMVTLNDWININ